MTVIANVELSDTFNSWRVRTNDLIKQFNLTANTTGSNSLTTNNATVKSNLTVNKSVTANTITIRYGGLTASGPIDFSNTTTFTANSIELRTPLPIANGGTGAITAQLARESLGASIVGNNVFTAATQSAARTALGAGVAGANVFTAASQSDGRLALGAGVAGANVFTAATAAVVRDILNVAEMVDVTNYGATGDGTTDDSAAFTAALATGKAVYVPAGTYAINSVVLTSGDVIIGSSRADVLLKVNANNAGAFTWANGERIRLSNMACTAAAGVTGARFFNQTDLTNHSAYCVFENIYTYRDLEFGWRGNFIYSRWQDCNDGQFGNAVGGQTHCMLYSSNIATGGNQSNMNLLINCQAFYADYTAGAIYIADGLRWLLIDCGFEQFSTYALYAQGVYNVDFQGCWFEANQGSNVLASDISPAPNSQSTYMIFQSCAFFLGGSTTAIVLCKANERISFRDCVLATVPSGTTWTESTGFSDDTQVWFLENNQVLSGTAGTLGRYENPAAGVAGANVFTSATQSAARLALGATPTGNNLFTFGTNNNSDIAAVTNVLASIGIVVSSNNIGIGTGATPLTKKFTVEDGIRLRAGGSLGSTYTQLAFQLGGSIVEHGALVDTSTTLIAALPGRASFCIISGRSNSGAGGDLFADIVLAGIGLGVSSVLASVSSGSPAARTYSESSGDLRLAMGSGTYAVRCTVISSSAG